MLGLFGVLISVSAQAQDVDVPGNLTMVNSTETEGNILKGGVPFLHNFGQSNTFLGSGAGNFAMSGPFNTAVGFQTLQSNTLGRGNTATGGSALLSNTTGFGNTATGLDALNSNTTGDYNTASGLGALQSNTTTSGNTATGANALHSNTTGGGNTAVGVQTLLSNTFGSFNTATGSDALYINTTGSGNTATGSSALDVNTTGENNTASGVLALGSNSTGNGNTAIGFHANVSTGDLTNATAIGFEALVDASNKVRVGNTSVTVIEGEVGFTSSSDRNRKENFQPVEGEEVLGKIRGLGLTSWNFIGHDPKQFRHYGLMAQDFFAAFGHDGIGTIGTETTITSTDMDGILMIAAQALEKRTEALRVENAELRARLEALEHKLGSLR
jgi:hypothetical protein